MNNSAQNLLDLKDKIDKGNIKQNKLQGQKEEALKTLKKDFKCKTIKEGKKLLKEMQKEVKKDAEVLKKQIENLAKKVEGK